MGPLIDEFQDVLHTDGHVVQEDHDTVRGVPTSIIQHGLQCQIPQPGQADNALTIILAGVDIAVLQEIVSAESLDLGADGLEDLRRAIIAVALDN